MTTPRRFEHDLPALLDDLYFAGTPDYRDDLVRQTARVRQRPAWTFPERWLPMELVTTRVPATRIPWRQIGVLALLVLLIAAAVIGYIGSREPRLPAPFGPADNGAIAYSYAGDIYSADPGSDVATAIVTGSETDVAPRFSHDGTLVVFERKLENDAGQLYVTQSDGSQLTLITPEPVVLTAAESSISYDFSPDGRSVLFMSSKNGSPTMSIAQSDGGGVSELDVGMPAERGSYRPPDGAEILFLGRENVASNYGVYAVDLVTGAVRPIVKPSADRDLTGAAWSPNGSRILYWSWNIRADGMAARTHVVSADGAGDRELPAPPDAVWNAVAAWSNDGTRIFLVRGYTSGFEDVRPAVLPADGSTVGVEIPLDGTAERDCCAAWIWSPDDSKILGRPGGTTGDPLRQVILDPVAGESRPVPWASTSDPAWQRVAR
jgi:dipeptidyl aminopeptidase/acylaminoacyl peptidase